METINRDELKKRMDSGENLAIIDVLAPEYYKKFHLPGAINVPLGNDFEQQIQNIVSDKNQPVVVYCANKQCPASSKAAKKMEDLGYEKVYDYEDGKEDWQAAGLPVER